MTSAERTNVVDTDLTSWRSSVIDAVSNGSRFAGMYGAHETDGCRIHVLLINKEDTTCLRALIQPDEEGNLRYLALTPDVPAAFWYERALHDLSGVVPTGHPWLEPLLLPHSPDRAAPQPGAAVRGATPAASGGLTEHRGPVYVAGDGVFTLPFGPVRSGVFESVEFLIETTGEDILHMNIRPHYKHRGVAKRFDGRQLDDGLLVAERVEGIASVAHALAFAHATESIGAVVAPPRARLIRTLHGELERIANHLDVLMRLSDAAGLAVATARFGWHKEEIMRLVSALCGSRFGRGVVRIGGVHSEPLLSPSVTVERLETILDRHRADQRSLLASASFLDRLRGTGHLDADLAATHGALGPVGRASAVEDDPRRHRKYDAFIDLATIEEAVQGEGDAMARMRVRLREIDTSARIIGDVCRLLATERDSRLAIDVPVNDGFALGWAEAPQGEVLYGLELLGGSVKRCFARSASLHNLVLFHDVFNGDVYTDFAFIEASFGLSYAGVAM